MQKRLSGIIALAFVVLFGFLAGCKNPANNSDPPLTGTVSISGTAQVGQTLTAQTGSLKGSGTIAYQWKRGTANIGTNSSTYTVVAADVGSTITVTVTRAGNSGSVTSAPTTSVTESTLPALTGTVSIAGTAQVGQTLTANTGALGGSGAIAYQWKRGSTNIGTNSSTYAIQASDAGSAITVTVTRSGNSGSLTSAATATVTVSTLPALTGTVSITGTAQVGQTLTANTSVLGGSGAITYEWRRGGITTIGTSSSTYVVQDADLGSTITVTVTRAGNSGSASSVATAPVINTQAQGTNGLNFALINSNSAYSVSKGSATAANVVIPGSYNGLPVTHIENNGFANYTGMTTITIPASVTNVGNFAFSGCNGLASITIPASVTNIGNSAFTNCSGLTEISIPFVGAVLNEGTHFGAIFGANTPSSQNNYIPSALKKVVVTGGTIIGAGAFSGCSGLTSVIISDSIKDIGANAFGGCSGLTSITIPAGVTSIGGNAFSGCSGLTSITIPFVSNTFNGTTITHFGYILGASSYSDQNFSIPASLKTVIIAGGSSIGDNAFFGCSGLTSITIPSSVTSIGDGAFAGCSGLTGITIPSGVTSIGGSAFSGCSGLTGSLTLPSSVTSIGGSAFLGCSGLTGSLTIPTGVTSIGDGAFAGCSGLTSVTIPSGVTSIGAGAFSGCTGLTGVTIPSSVTSIGQFTLISGGETTTITMNVFSNCSGLTSITVESGNTVYRSEGNCLIQTSNNVLIAGCKNSIIPSSVTSIGNEAFRGCTGLTSVTIPSAVTSIDQYAFTGCSGLTGITIPSGVTSIGGSAFYGCSRLTSVAIPASVTSIGIYAFSTCDGLTEVFYGGANYTAWVGISISISNTPLTSATRYYYSETHPGTANTHWRYVGGVPTVWE